MQVLDLAINTLTYGSILFFGSLFVVHSLQKPAHATAAVVVVEVKQAQETTTLSVDEPSLEELFQQADKIINTSVTPPISVEKADQNLNTQIASLLATENAVSSAINTISTPVKPQEKTQSSITARKTAKTSAASSTIRGQALNTDLCALDTPSLVKLAKEHKFPGAAKWSKNRAIGQKTREQVIRFLQGKL